MDHNGKELLTNTFLYSSARVVEGLIRADVHHLRDQSTFDELDEDIYNKKKEKSGKREEDSKDSFETEESEDDATSSPR